MSRHDWDDEPDDWDDDHDPDDPDDDDTSLTVACPVCGADVYEDAEHCPSCGDFIVLSTSPWTGKPLWWVLLGLAGIFAVMWVLF